VINGISSRTIMKAHRHAALFSLGRPLSPLYALAMKLRALLYRKGVMKKVKLNVPVISVGNLTLGGSGKTPLVIYLARLLKKHGFRPAVVSRGYHGASTNPVNIVSDGSSILMEAKMAGDEPLMLARTLDDVVVATGKKRAQVCRQVLATYPCDVIILDDGFQHIGLHRDIDLVLFDVNHFAGNSRVFPGGDLREPITALQRSSAFVITGVVDECRDRAKKCRELLRQLLPDKTVFICTPHYSGFAEYRISSDSVETSRRSQENVPARLFGFSGIAQPERFYRMAAAAGIDLTGRKLFRDHHHYTTEDISNLHRHAEESGAAGFLTTEKDMVKLTDPVFNTPLPFYVPLLENLPNEDLDAFIIERLG
jgi:tetraacyldisaccharide 4'-kinase